MLNSLPSLFFFAALMGSPLPGFFAFFFIGIWASWRAWRHPLEPGHWNWSAQDGWIALSFMSIVLFKLLSVLWSDQPRLALTNAGWHLYFLFWPLVLLGVDRCKTTQQQIDKAIATGLIFVALWRGMHALTGLDMLHPGSAGVGLLAQLAMIMGSWNLLALTRNDNTPPRWRTVQAIALIGTLIILVVSTRRQELFEFIFLCTGILAYRYRNYCTPWRAVLGILLMLALLALLVGIRWEKFTVGFQEIQDYIDHGTQNIEVSSWGARLEMWRVGWAAFCDNPWLGLSASARPSGLQIYGAPALEVFGHRHFHQQFLQTLVEGGLLGLAVLLLSLGYSIREMIIKPFKTQPEISLLAAALLGSYFMEGLVSAALVYDKPNAVLVITSSWLWVQIRRSQVNGQNGI
jgi:O-antigen ligase